MIKRFTHIFSLIFFFYSFLAYSLTINWEDNQILRFGTDSIDVLSFEEAQYFDGSFLPYYTQTKLLSPQEAKAYDYAVRLTNVNTSILNEEISGSLTNNFDVDFQVTSARGQYALEIRILPLKQVDGTIFQLNSFDLNIENTPKISRRSLRSSGPFASESVLKSGDWTKVAVKTTGIYKLTYSELSNMGITPSKVSVFTAKTGKLSTMITNYESDLKEIPIYDGGDYILFYGQAADSWTYNSISKKFEHLANPFWDENYYFITSDIGEQKRITDATAVSGSPSKTYTTFVDYGNVEPQIESIDDTGDDWYSDAIYNGQSFSNSFSFDDVVDSTATMTMAIAAKSVGSSHTMGLYINGSKQEDVSLSTTDDGITSMAAYEAVKTYDFTPSSNTITAKMTFSCTETSASGWIDYFTVNVIRDLKLRDDYLIYRNAVDTSSIVNYTISGASSNSVVWDITDIYDVKNIAGSYNASSLSYNTEGNALKEFVVLNLGSNFLKPTTIGTVSNQNLHAIEVPDMVIITDEAFISAAEDLAAIHEADGLSSYITTQEKIFNEYSGGKADVTAIRWFMKNLYDRDSQKFKYLLLFGDGSINNGRYERGPLAERVAPGILLTYESDESLDRSKSYVSDDYFGLLDDNEGNGSNIEAYDKVDIGVGRIPITTLAEGDAVVNKIYNYMHNSRATTWKNRVCLVADDEDGNTHVKDADKLAEKIRRENPSMAVKKVYIDAFEQVKTSSGSSYPDAKALIDNYIEEGVLIWGYTGHGSPNQLADENVMHINHVNSFDNMANLPIWVTATCDFCPYDHNKEVSSGERVLLNSIGGGAALFTTTRLVYSTSNYTITNSFYSYIFNSDDVTGEKYRLGDVVRLTKSTIGTGANKRKFALIGDPALQLINAVSNDFYSINTESINGQQIDEFTDTLESLSYVTITAYVADENGDTVTSFNGDVYPTVYDKISTLKTLANDDTSEEMDFLMWNSILFRGKATAVNGRFSFSFILPKDIDYNSGVGRIEYYAVGDEFDVNGYYEDFYIGGFDENFIPDSIGPEIDLYMNSTNFSSGDEVNPDPLLIAYVSDSSGINTSGNSIGHDIMIKLNDDPNTIKIINSSYVSDAGDYTQGTVSYALKDLEEGTHTLLFKAWDMQNNSSTKEITFTVNNNALPDLAAVYCYPNPVSISSGEQVRFIAEHDRPNQTLGVNLYVFNANGRIVHASTDYAFTPSNEVYFDWTPISSLRSGLYFYRITIDDGEKVSTGKAEKLLLVD